MSDYNRGSRPIENLGGKNFVRQAATPQSRINMEIPQNKGSGKLVIQKATKTNISIDISSGSSATITRQSQGNQQHQFQPNIQTHPPSNQNSFQSSIQIQNNQPHISTTPKNMHPQQGMMQHHPNSFNAASFMAAQQGMMQQSFMAPRPVMAQQNQGPIAQTSNQGPMSLSNQFTPPPPPPAPDFFSKLSLLSYVSSAKEGKSFNDTDLNSLGIDLNEKEPMLPMLHSVLSDAPLSSHSVYPTPSSYSSLSTNEDPTEKMNLFSIQILFFIFYTQVKTDMQVAAAEELIKRGYSYDEDKGTWSNTDGSEWDVNQWKLIEATTNITDE